MWGRATRWPRPARKAEITEGTYYRWRKAYGGLKLDHATRLKELDKENGRSKILLDSPRKSRRMPVVWSTGRLPVVSRLFDRVEIADRVRSLAASGRAGRNCPRPQMLA